MRSRSNKNPDSGTVPEGEQAAAGSAFGHAADPGSRNGQNGQNGQPGDLGTEGVPQPEAPLARGLVTARR